MYFNHSAILAADTGLGKTVMSLATACMLLEDDKIDFLMVACESNKVWEWADDIALFTDLTPIRYVGTPGRRAKIRSRIASGEINCIVGVYETYRNDMATKVASKKNKSGETLIRGPLTEVIQNLRVLYLKDEGAAKMGANRGSQLYKSHEMLSKKMGERLRIIEISGTPVNKDPVGYFNIGRLMKDLGTIDDFNRDHGAAFRNFEPTMFKNLDPDMTEPGKISLKEKMADILIVKSKSDPDIIDLFPKEIQDYTYVRFSDEEMAFYKWLISEYSTDPQNEAALYTVLRQFCAHPMALSLSQGGVSQNVVAKVGKGALEALGSSKCSAVVSRMRTILSQDAQVVAFTFFGQSALPLYHQAFLDEGWKVSINHGRLSVDQKRAAQNEFRSGKTQIFLSSDAGARGINLPEAAYVEEIDIPTLWATHHQRVNRISRVDSKNPTIFLHAWAVKDTLEDEVVSKMLLRKGYSDSLVAPSKITNAMMKDMLREKREKV